MDENTPHQVKHLHVVASPQKKTESIYGPPSSVIPAVTPKLKLERLENLLTRTGFYVKFLAEKMEVHKERMSNYQDKKDVIPVPEKRRGRRNPVVATDTGNSADPTGMPTDELTKQRELDSIFPLLKLRDYQKEGVAWLIGLYENGLNGILADEMGLGKTVQCIGLIAYLRRKGVQCPYLITAPVSTLSNWVNEFQRFAPDIPVLLYHGTIDEREQLRRHRMSKLDQKFPVIVTSYDLVINDLKYLDRFPWKFVIVDEGHRIKNLNCKLLRDLKSLRSMHRILLSGTPLHNNLSELWSMLNFLMPAIFDDLETFENWFNFSDIGERAGAERIIGEENRSQIVTKLHKLLKPFLLRRLKCDVEQELPKKKEYLVYAPFTDIQREFYQAILRGELRDLLVKRKMSSVVPIVQETPKNVSKRSTYAARNAAEWTKRRKDDEEANTMRAEMAAKVRNDHDDDEEEEEEEEEEKEEGGAHFLSDEETETPGEDNVDKTFRGKRGAMWGELMKLRADQERREEDCKLATAHRSVNQLFLQNMIMQLRKICNHPYLFEYPLTDDGDFLMTEALIQSTGKMMLFDRMLSALLLRGHKVLIFSQMTKMLDILQDYCYMRKLDFCRIDGGVDQVDRQKQIELFNSDPDVKIFLLSTRAGGLGINLTAADTVIIYDSDWNPQADLQAQDRCHRIGQTKPVVVYRLVTGNTVESKILDRAASKRKLEKLVIRRGAFKTFEKSLAQESLELQELHEILWKEEAESVAFHQEGRSGGDNAVLSEKELEMLLDRSEKAFETHSEGMKFKVFESTANDMMAQLDRPE